MKKAFAADYEKIITRAQKNPNCKLKALRNYAFIKCSSSDSAEKAFFIQKKGKKGEGFLLESENEKRLLKKIYSLFHPEKIEVIKE